VGRSDRLINVRRLRRNSRHDPADVLSRWCAAVQPPGALDPPLLHASAAAVVDALLHHPLDLDDALTRFGRRVGSEGWALSDGAEWLDRLASVVVPDTDALRRFDAGIAFAEGWAAGFLQGLRDDATTNPVTGLATLPLLGLRLHQIYDQCDALGIDAPTAFGLLVIDLDLALLPPIVRDATRAVAADRVRATFHSGETICDAEPAVVVLVSRTPELTVRTALLEGALRRLPELNASPPILWLESLPAGRDQIDHLLLDVAGR
jgi:hypothetical protein